MKIIYVKLYRQKHKGLLCIHVNVQQNKVPLCIKLRLPKHTVLLCMKLRLHKHKILLHMKFHEKHKVILGVKFHLQKHKILLRVKLHLKNIKLLLYRYKEVQSKKLHSQKHWRHSAERAPQLSLYYYIFYPLDYNVRFTMPKYFEDEYYKVGRILYPTS
jgi:hypothetical protein